MDWPAVVLSLVSGLLGAVIGVAGATKLHHDEERNLNRGAARVTYFELVENLSYMTAALDRRVSTVVGTTTWPETRARLATSLSPGEFATVATAYAKLTATQLAWAHTVTATPQNSASLEATRAVLKRVEAAGVVLERIGWDKEADRVALVDVPKESR